MGRRKITIEKIEKKHQRHICFSKRRMGLFKKAADIAALGCEIAIIAFSDFGNIFTFGHTDVDEVARRYIGDHHQLVLPYHEGRDREEVLEPEREEEAMKLLGWINGDDHHGDDNDEGETERSKEVATAERTRVWWNRPMDGLKLEELEEMETALAELQTMAKERENEMLLEEPLSLWAWASR